ncbi:hypothetical protein D3C87_985780 [compost metagenome]
MPFPSSKLHVTTVVPCVVIGKIVVVVPEIIPAQASIAAGIAGVAEHCSCISAKTGAIGAAVSLIMTFWFTVAIFPFPSSKLQVTIVVP